MSDLQPIIKFESCDRGPSWFQIVVDNRPVGLLIPNRNDADTIAHWLDMSWKDLR